MVSRLLREVYEPGLRRGMLDGINTQRSVRGLPPATLEELAVYEAMSTVELLDLYRIDFGEILLARAINQLRPADDTP